MQQANPELTFDQETMRALVAADPFVAYTQERHTNEAEEHWLERLFRQQVLPDPGLRYQYRTIAARRKAAGA